MMELTWCVFYSILFLRSGVLTSTMKGDVIMTDWLANTPLVMGVIALLWLIALVARYRRAVWQQRFWWWPIAATGSMGSLEYFRRRRARMSRLFTCAVCGVVGLWLTLPPDVPATMGTLGGLALTWSLASVVNARLLPKSIGLS